MKKNIYSQGFTLIELLVVIAIIAILTAIILASSTGARSAARDGQRIADIKTLQLKLEQYYTNNRTYPPNLDDLKPQYILEIPKDPSTQARVYKPTPSGCTGVALNLSKPCTAYTIEIMLENKNAKAENGGLIYKVSDPYTKPLQ